MFFSDGVECLIKTRIVFDGVVNMKISARSLDPGLNELLVSSI